MTGSDGAGSARRIVDEALAVRPAGTRLPVVHWTRLLAAYGLRVAVVAAAPSVERALEVADELGYPVVLRHVPGGPVTVQTPAELVATAPPGELLVQRHLGPTRPVLMWTAEVAAAVAALRRDQPEIDELDLVMEVDGAGRSWVVDATVHVAPARQS